MINDETIIKQLSDLLKKQTIDTSFTDGKITYNGNSFTLPSSGKSSANSKRTTNLKNR